MTLREMLASDVHRIQDQIGDLLDREDGLVMLPTAIVAGLLFVYFGWRATLRRRVLGERDAHRKAA